MNTTSSCASSENLPVGAAVTVHPDADLMLVAQSIQTQFGAVVKEIHPELGAIALFAPQSTLEQIHKLPGVNSLFVDA